VQADHYKLIREIGAASTVLLKNTDGALPLNLSKYNRIGIFGSDAGPNPDGPNGCGDRACDQGTLAMGWGSGTASMCAPHSWNERKLTRCSAFPYLVDPSAAINAYVQANKPTTVVESIFSDYNYGAVQNVAKYADACLVFANSNSGEGYLTVDNNLGDRNNLTLWHDGDTLIAQTASVCPNTIVVLHTVGPVLVEAWIDHPNVTAVLAAGLPGQESGNAIVDVLFGAVNPSGRLPYTIAKQRSDYSAEVLYTSDAATPQVTYSEGLNIDYRHFDTNDITPRFEFGFGLSYTTVSLRLCFAHTRIHADVFDSSRTQASA
jgi:beta-glucosidase